MWKTIPSAKSLLAVVVILLLLASATREMHIRHIESLGVEFPDDWTFIERSLLWRPPGDVVILEDATVQMARHLRWVSGFANLSSISGLELEPEFFRELGTQSKVRTVSIVSAITDEQLASFDVFPHLKSLELVDSKLTCDRLPLLRDLEILLIRGPLSKSGVARVASLPNLKDLLVYDARLGKEDILRLLSAPNLKSLEADECLAMTEAECRSVADMYPHISIWLEFVEGATLDEWRSSRGTEVNGN